MLQIRLLGQFDVLLDGKRVTITSRAGQSLFAFMVLNAGRAHRREKLAGTFWPDTSDDIARKNLRQELWRIRKALTSQLGANDDLIVADELAVTFNAQAHYWLDVAQLERAVSADDSTSDLISSLQLYRGELLPGFYDDWIILERERVQALFEAKTGHLLERLLAEERWNLVQEWAERWLAVGDSPEAAYRALMLAHGARGDMAKVAVIYRRCAQDLRDQLGVEPSAETRALYDGLLQGAHAPLRTSTVQPSGTVTFLFTDIEGSTRLLDELREQYATVLADQRDLLRAALRKWNGREVDAQGDAFFFSFAHALDAVQCAADAQRSLAAHSWPQGKIVRVRMGLHSGEPSLASTGYIGMDVHRAARIGDAGHGGQVLLSQTTRELVVHELPKDMSVRELGEHRLKDLKYPSKIYQLVVEGLPDNFPPLRSVFTGTENPAPGEPPFKGLQYFDEADSELFFGREVLTAKLVNRLRESQFLSVIVGASGSGKSSIVRAGLIPALKKGEPLEDGTRPPSRSRDWRVEILTPTAHPLEALATQLTRDSESVTATATLVDDLAKDPRSLHLYLRRILTPSLPLEASVSEGDEKGGSKNEGHVLLVIDQFEELFTLCRDELEREQFIDNLLYAVKKSEDLTLVITLRADFYAHLAHYPELREMAAHQQEYVGPMTTEELRRAIEEPAKRGHWDFELGLVDLILRDVGDEPGALPLLSHALLETWKRRAGHTLTLKGYADAGGVRGAIAQSAESVYRNLSSDHQTIARNIFLRLTELGEGTEDTRRRVEIKEIETGAAAPESVREVISKLADARLITTSEQGVEVAHEALIREWPTLREWLNQDREGLQLHRHLTEAAQEWELLERDAGALYRSAHLAQAREWSALHPNALNAQERTFLEASQESEENEETEREAQRQRELEAARKLAEEQKARAEESTRANKQLRQRAVFLAGAFLLALILAGIALFFSERANQNAFAAQQAQSQAVAQQRIATSRELAASSLGNLSVDPERSILLALQAVSVTYSMDRTVLPQAEDALHRAVLASRARLTLCCHKDSLVTAAYSPNGARLATASQDGTAKIWDAATGKELMTLGGVDESNAVNLLVYSPDGTRVVTGHDDHSAKVWDVATGRVMLTLSGHSDYVNAVAYSPDGVHIATASGDNTVKMWDAATGKELYTLSEADHAGSVSGVAFSPDGRRFATAGIDRTVRIRDVATGRELAAFSGHTNAVNKVTFSPDGTRLATVSDDNTAKVWDMTTGAQQLSLNLSAKGLGVAFSPNGKLLATSGFDGTAIVWDASSGKALLTLFGHTSAIYDIAFSPDGTRLATAARDHTAKVWDITPSRELLTFNAADPPGIVSSLAYSPDGTRLATAVNDKANVWDAASGQLLLTFSGHTANVNFVAFSRDGTRLVTTSKDNTAKVWDAVTGKDLYTLTGHTGSVLSAAFSPDGTRLATAGEDGAAKVWDVAAGKELLTISSSGRLTNISFSPDGKKIVTTGTVGNLHLTVIWDAATGERLLELPSPGKSPLAVGFSPDGKQLALGYVDGSMNVYTISPDGTQATELFAPGGHSGSIEELAYSPDGKRFATASDDGTTKIWDATTGNEMLTLSGHQGGVRGVAFSSDGTRLATGGIDGTVRIYLLRIEDLVALARSRLTRGWTLGECQKFLHSDQCPPP